MSGEAPTLDFLGAAGTVTGARFLLGHAGRRLLVDCGLFQGLKELRLRNWRRFPVEESLVDAVVLSHAHIDHSGYLPRLVREGFAGPVYCTPATRDLLAILLLDAARLQEEEASYANRKGFSKHRPALPLFDARDVERTLGLIAARRYGEGFSAVPGVDATFRRAGHILGSATVRLSLKGGEPIVLAYSGDLGRTDQPILRDPEPIEEADYLLLESTYGDRFHGPDPVEGLCRIVNETAERQGVLLIPSFAVGRAQMLLWHLDRLRREGRIPAVPTFLDSPMAARVSEVTCRHGDDLDGDMRQAMDENRCPICHRTCAFVTAPEESKALNDRAGPMIVIAGSGMATGGRILHHFKRRLPDPNTTVLFVGFQAPGTRGHTLQQGGSALKMHGEFVPVRARIAFLDGLSAHADQDEIVRWLGGFRRPPRMTYLVHGTPAGMEGLARRLRTLGWPVQMPADGERVLLGGN